jgi:hypothetical protein
VKQPKHKLMEEEIFGPVLTIYVYPDAEYEQTVRQERERERERGREREREKERKREKIYRLTSSF